MYRIGYLLLSNGSIKKWVLTFCGAYFNKRSFDKMFKTYRDISLLDFKDLID